MKVVYTHTHTHTHFTVKNVVCSPNLFNHSFIQEECEAIAGEGSESAFYSKILGTKFKKLKWQMQLKFGNKDLHFIYTKVGKVRFKPRSGFTLWILSKEVYIFHSGFKRYAGGKKHDVNSFHELSKAVHVYKNALLLHTSKSKLNFSIFDKTWYTELQNFLHI